jgi:uncharacterized metal-binding protein YceD (DUF177 family)
LKALHKYNIGIAHLENKTISFNLDGGAAFFEHFEVESIKNGSFTANIQIDKSETMLNINFDITGVLQLVCDRSLEEFDFPFATSESIILKFGDHDEELASGIRILNRTTQQINVAQDIYELISLTVPMKKLHPRFLTEEYNDSEGFVVYSTLKEDKKEAEEIIIDPRWAALTKLK